MPTELKTPEQPIEAPIEWNSPVTRDLEGNLSTGITPLREGTLPREEVITDPEPIKEPVTEPTKEPIKKPEPVKEPIKKPEPVKEPTKESIKEPDQTIEEEQKAQEEVKQAEIATEQAKIDLDKSKEDDTPVEKSAESIFAEQNWIRARTNKDGSITFLPDNIDQALDLMLEFWPSTKIADWTKEKIAATKAFQTYSKYKWASTDTYVQWLRTNQIATSGETWERLVRMNWGQPTAEMLAAQEKFERETKTGEVNSTISIASWWEITDQEKVLKTDIEKLDSEYIKSQKEQFWDLADLWTDYKAGNEKLSDLNNSMTTTSNEITTLQKEKRFVIRDLKRANPHASLGTILQMASQQIELIDDQLFQKRLDYNSEFASYKFESEKAKWEYEHWVKQVESKMNFLSGMYWIKRWDIIRKEDLDRQDTRLAASITRQDKLLEDSISRQDEVGAKNHAYKIALMKEQAAINKEAQTKFQWFSTEGWIMVFNPSTGSVEFKETWAGVSWDWVTPTTEASWDIAKFNFRTPGGTDKELQVDSVLRYT